MLPKKVEEILNVQIDKEGYSSNLYLAMASWAENEGFAGVSEWLYEQADEELTEKVMRPSVTLNAIIDSM